MTLVYSVRIPAAQRRLSALIAEARSTWRLLARTDARWPGLATSCAPDRSSGTGAAASEVTNGRTGKADFLYGPSDRDGSIELRPGVSFCFRQFYSLIQDAVRSAWLRDVRSLNGNLLGETLDLREFLFGTERSALVMVRPVMMHLQDGKCFYCSQPVRSDGGHIDHFIPWSKYPIDLGHNFVLADNRCNGKKRDRIPHVDHLAAWSERNRDHGAEIAAALKDRLPCDLECANRIAFWAYAQTETARGLTWLRGDELIALSPGWRSQFALPC